MQPFEKLGAFYLGQEFDVKSGTRLDRPIMYDARDLTTHAVCVGMTGSGKTGLCIDLLEEAAIDKVPTIIIDPKGDITNLLLTFPELRPEDFEPWINVDDARRTEKTTGEYAGFIADRWRKGLADWGQGPERIRMLKDSGEFRIYTPGSDAGVPISIMVSLNPPALAWEGNQELLRERIRGTVSAILGLVGIEADPLRSREHILLAHIFEHFWRSGEDLDLGRLISAVQKPPVKKVGVLDIESFFGEKDRFGLAMAINNIVASPSFATWLEGESLDISRVLHTAEGKPRHSIFYIAHLSDAERMFFVTLLLEQIVTWMRQQSGTTSLRALLYFDEVFGFFPPVANPPSKRPLLTLLKQARAFGFGVVLTTQNPVDLDYKGLSNAGTWFIGKLQTERDKMRLLEGLETAAGAAGASMNRAEIDRTISGLGSRVFLLHNIHEEHPVVFQTRWAMSYLRGPMTRNQVRDLVSSRKPEAGEVSAAAATRGATSADAQEAAGKETQASPARREKEGGYSTGPPTLPPGLDTVFLPVRTSRAGAVDRLERESGQLQEDIESDLVYEPALLAMGLVSFVDRRRRIGEDRRVSLLVPSDAIGSIIRWDAADPVDFEPEDLGRRPEGDALFGPIPAGLSKAADVKAHGNDFKSHLYRDQEISLYRLKSLKLTSEAGESESDFKVRAQQVAREMRDQEVDKLRRKYERKLDRLETRLFREERELDEDKATYEGRKREELLSAGETVVGLLGLFGRRKRTGLSTAARRRRMTSSAKADIKESEAEIARLMKEIEGMRGEMQEEAEAISARWDAVLDDIETFSLKPRRSDVRVQLVTLAWAPFWEVGYRTIKGIRTHSRIPAWD